MFGRYLTYRISTVKCNSTRSLVVIAVHSKVFAEHLILPAFVDAPSTGARSHGEVYSVSVGGSVVLMMYRKLIDEPR